MTVKQELAKKILNSENPFPHIIGLEHVKSEIISAIVAQHHIILVGAPGMGKTTIAKELTYLLNTKARGQTDAKKHDSLRIIDNGNSHFVRIQGSPDLTVEDIMGDIDPAKAMKYGSSSIEAFVPGKIFKANESILFFDELNRCPQKLQNALLQVLEEGTVTIGNYDFDFGSDFLLIGTMNPEDAASEELSDVFLDRVDVIYVNYPEKLSEETEIIKIRGSRICDFPDDLLNYALGFVRDLRKNEQVEKKPSVRASISLYERSQANALLAGRKKVEASDVKNALVSVLSHRIKLKPSAEYLEKEEEFVKREFDIFFNNQLRKKQRESGDSG